MDPAPISAPLGRVVVPFQYNWRFHFGDDPSSPPGAGPGSCSSAFEDDLADRPICTGMERNPNRFSERDCKTACCYDPNCFAWQAFPLSKGRQCFHGYGSNITCSPANGTGMGGGRRAAPPVPAFRTDYAFAADASSAVDASWPLVDAPHDFIAEFANFTYDNTNMKQGYLPRNTSWYRKHFSLPAAWRDGGATYVHFEGVFHHATVFLNGKYLQSHDGGYTGFSVRIDNTSALRYGSGGANVIAVRADASLALATGTRAAGSTGRCRSCTSRRYTLSSMASSSRRSLSPAACGAGAICPTAELEAVGAGAPRDAWVRFTLLDGATVLATNSSAHAQLQPVGATSIVTAELRPAAGSVRPWSLQDPQMYTVRAEVMVGGASVDAVETRRLPRRALGRRPLCRQREGVRSARLQPPQLDRRPRRRAARADQSLPRSSVARPRRQHLAAVAQPAYTSTSTRCSTRSVCSVGTRRETTARSTAAASTCRRWPIW